MKKYFPTFEAKPPFKSTPHFGVNHRLINAAYGTAHFINSALYHSFNSLFDIGAFSDVHKRSYQAIDRWLNQHQSSINQRWFSCADQNNWAFQSGSLAGSLTGECMLGAGVIRGAYSLGKAGTSLARGFFRPIAKPVASLRNYYLPRTLPNVNNGGWILPEQGGGAFINNRWYVEHALERMAPNTPQVMATLEARFFDRALVAKQKLPPKEFNDWLLSNRPNPRGVPPSVVEAEIAHKGSTGVRVILNKEGNVVTVIPGN